MTKASISAADTSRAQRQLRLAGSANALRQAQAVLLPLEWGLSLPETARVIGRSVGWTSRLRKRFLSSAQQSLQPRGGRRRQNMTPAQERMLLAPFAGLLASDSPGIACPLRDLMVAALGRPVPLSTVYALLHRHGWRGRRS